MVSFCSVLSCQFHRYVTWVWCSAGIVFFSYNCLMFAFVSSISLHLSFSFTSCQRYSCHLSLTIFMFFITSIWRRFSLLLCFAFTVACISIFSFLVFRPVCICLVPAAAQSLTAAAPFLSTARHLSADFPLFFFFHSNVFFLFTSSCNS